MKTCTRCKQTKPLDDFYRRNTARDGRRGECKVCDAERARAWDRANWDRHKEIRRKSYHRKPDRQKEASRKWYAENREQARSNQQDWERRNRPVRRAIQRKMDHRRRARQRANVVNRWLVSECDRLACFWCGRGLLGALPELDHVMPLSLGGADHESNIVWTCQSCNRHKQAKHPLVWIAELVA